MEFSLWITSLQCLLFLPVAFLVLASAKRRVLVIGGTRFIGRHTVELLRVQPDVHVEILHTGRSPSRWPPEEVPETLCERQSKCLAEKLRESWWLVIDFPVYTITDAQAIFDNAQFVNHYVFISTDDVYMVCDRARFEYKDGRLLEDAVRPAEESEQHRLNAEDDYGDDKKKIEEKLMAEMPDQFTSLRLPDVWGPYENTGRFSAFLRGLAEGHALGLTIPPHDKSGQTFAPAFVFAKDVAQMVTLLVNVGPQGVMNLGVSETPTLRELIEFTHALLPDPPPLQLEHAARAPLVSVDVGPLSIERALSVGFKPTPWRVGWREAVDAAMDSLTPPPEADDRTPLPLPKHMGLGRVRLRQEDFRRSFSRFIGDAINGLTYGKLKRAGRECVVTDRYRDRTITCLFDDGDKFDFPWEAVAEELPKREEL